MAKCSCCNGNFTGFKKKIGYVEYFIDLLKNQRENLGNVNEGQQVIYDNFIQCLEMSPRTINMRDVRSRLIVVEDCMEFKCGERDDEKDFRKVFDYLWSVIRTNIREELHDINKEEQYWQPILSFHRGWEANPHFCPECKVIYDRTVQFGLMNEDYTWKDATTKHQIAEWVDMFAFRYKIQKKWAWAEEVWGLSNLSQRKYENAETKDLSKLDVVKRIFEI